MIRRGGCKQKAAMMNRRCSRFSSDRPDDISGAAESGFRRPSEALFLHFELRVDRVVVGSRCRLGCRRTLT